MSRILYLVSTSCIVILLVWFLSGWLGFLLVPAAPDRVYWRVITVAKGASLSHIAQMLQDEKLIKDAKKFAWYGRLLGASRSIKAGGYRLSPHLTPGNIIDILSKGTPHLYRVRIQEGWTIRDIAKALVRQGIVYDENDMISLAFDKYFANAAGIDSFSVEGYLYPDSYYFARGSSPKVILNTMIRKFWAVFNEEFRNRSKETNLSIHQIVTLSSIIAKESGHSGELPLVSAVFHNRLRKGMRLQADPTVIYGILKFKGNLTKKDLIRYTPYNTYLISGLPPGPIGSPGRKAIHAALFPSPHDYLYFVSKKDGTHAFASNLRDHINNVRRYQLSSVKATNLRGTESF